MKVKMSHFNNHTTMKNKGRSIFGKDCPSLVSIALIKTMAKSNFWRKSLCQYAAYSTS